MRMRDGRLVNVDTVLSTVARQAIGRWRRVANERRDVNSGVHLMPAAVVLAVPVVETKALVAYLCARSRCVAKCTESERVGCSSRTLDRRPTCCRVDYRVQVRQVQRVGRRHGLVAERSARRGAPVPGGDVGGVGRRGWVGKSTV